MYRSHEDEGLKKCAPMRACPASCSLNPVSISRELKQVIEGRETFSLEEARSLAFRLLAGEAAEIELAALLGAMGARGETAEEIAGFALALREAAVPLPLSEAERDELVDTCGTGGDGSGTFNISTAAALVAAAAGAKVAKHGNRAVTSRCGSADVLEALGVPISLAPEAAVAALRAHGFCFLLAPAHHPGMRAVLPVRRTMGVRTIFNVLGPLLNPAGARRQVMGVYAARLSVPVAQAMLLLEVRHACVVHGAGGLDELALGGPSQVVTVRVGSDPPMVEDEISPEFAGLARAPMAALAGGDAQTNAAILQTIFAGRPGPPRDVVLLNAAAVLTVAGRAPDLVAGVHLAARMIDSGAVLDLLDRLRA